MENKKDSLKRDEFSIFLHGTLVRIFEKGVLIRGDSSSGKSSLAFELIKRGHLFIADDLVKITKNKSQELIGSSPNAEKLIEIRPFGIFDVEEIFNKEAIQETQKIDFVVDFSEKEKTNCTIFNIICKQYFIDFSCQQERVNYIEKIALLQGKENKFLVKKNSNNQRKKVEDSKNCLCEK